MPLSPARHSRSGSTPRLHEPPQPDREGSVPARRPFARRMRAPSPQIKEHIVTIDLTRQEIILVGAAATLAGGGLVAVPGMEDAMAKTQSEVRALLDSWSGAIRIKDIDRLMSLYSPDIVYFDVVPPLQYAGAAALRGRFLQWFGSWKGSIG